VQAVRADYQRLVAELEGERVVFLQRIAEKVQQQFNAVWATFPQDTIAQKRMLRDWCNRELKALNLCLKCPKTGAGSDLQVAIGNHPESGTFQFIHYAGGKTIVSASRDSVKSVQLTPDHIERAENILINESVPNGSNFADRVAGQKKSKKIQK
jgi:hypothetical protein